MAHEPTTADRVAPVAETGHVSHDAFVVLGIVAVIVGAAAGSLAVALLVFAAPALALGGAHFVRSHL